MMMAFPENWKYDLSDFPAFYKFLTLSYNVLIGLVVA